MYKWTITPQIGSKKNRNSAYTYFRYKRNLYLKISDQFANDIENVTNCHLSLSLSLALINN